MAVSAISPKASPKGEYGTFRDSLRAPIHRWFAYPAGYSHKFVEAKASEYGLGEGATIADPFVGTGTTSLAARALGANSVGVEAHKFVHWVAATKMRLDYDLAALADAVDGTLGAALAHLADQGREGLPPEWPALVHKCFSDANLRELAALRRAVAEYEGDDRERDFMKLALTATLRIVTTAGAGWPYIAPSKHHERKTSKRAMDEFGGRCRLMMADVQQVQALGLPRSTHRLELGDARNLEAHLDDESVDLMITSPPYLNNYDYADRTRLETYFWGIHSSWADITRDVRDRLVMAATTQVRMSDMNGVRECPGIRAVDAGIHAELRGIIGELERMRGIKSGKKTYDYVVAGYFEDMLRALQGAHAALKPGGAFALVVGDSAPYGVHIQTERVIGELGVAAGFSRYDVEQIRERGGRWGHNPQRHKTPLRECILTITK